MATLNLKGRIINEMVKGLAEHKRYIVNKGGARSGKTFATLTLLIYIALTQRDKLITVTSENLPHLKKGALKDFRNIIAYGNLDDYFIENKSNLTYTCGATNSSIEFSCFADYGRAHGPQRDILFINECNNVSWEIADQLMIRTSDTVFLDFNPVSSSWVDEQVLGKPNCLMIHSTYIDNPYLSKLQIEEIEKHKPNINWWRVYGLGETGFVEGAVYTDWMVDEYKHNAEKTYIGIDFGFTNDPTAIIQISRFGDDLYIKELCYQKGLLNADIAKILKDNGLNNQTKIVADSAENKSISEINRFGFTIRPVKKGTNSIINGISLMQNFHLHIDDTTTKTIDTNGEKNIYRERCECNHIVQELQNYCWEKDNNGNMKNTAVDKYNHALDATRYAVSTFINLIPLQPQLITSFEI